MQSEWDPILTPELDEYMLVRLNGKELELKLMDCNATVHIAAEAIPQLIKCLQRLEPM